MGLYIGPSAAWCSARVVSTFALLASNVAGMTSLPIVRGKVGEMGVHQGIKASLSLKASGASGTTVCRKYVFRLLTQIPPP